LCCLKETTPIQMSMQRGGNEPEFCHVENQFF
jgi:hypothetical protein